MIVAGTLVLQRPQAHRALCRKPGGCSCFPARPSESSAHTRTLEIKQTSSRVPQGYCRCCLQRALGQCLDSGQRQLDELSSWLVLLANSVERGQSIDVQHAVGGGRSRRYRAIESDRCEDLLFAFRLEDRRSLGHTIPRRLCRQPPESTTTHRLSSSATSTPAPCSRPSSRPCAPRSPTNTRSSKTAGVVHECCSNACDQTRPVCVISPV